MTDAFTLLRRAADLLPDEAVSAGGVTVGDVHEEIGCREWELALYLLIELGDSPAVPGPGPGPGPGPVPVPVAFWEILAEAARQMMLDRSSRWCRWRARETEHGIFRATLTLLTPEEGGTRRSAFAGDGRLVPVWDIGLRTAGGERSTSIARLWVESAESLGPGETGEVRLAPLTPAHWTHLARGDVITMHEGRPVVGTATVTEVWLPVPPPRTALLTVR
ncbi:hypothetical protein [Streptomyces sp. NPDC048442]|uniref:hypothetical protein n=1 Tax=Streptomyces sp. NPDC048442 TaxID=3154823 RepID=UPI003426A28E